MDANLSCCRYCRKERCIVIDGSDAARIISSLFGLKVREPFTVCIECDHQLGVIANFWQSLGPIVSPVTCTSSMGMTINTERCIICPSTRTFEQDRDSMIVSFLVTHATRNGAVELSADTVSLCCDCLFALELWERYEILARKYETVQPAPSKSTAVEKAVNVGKLNVALRKVPLAVIQEICEQYRSARPNGGSGRKRGARTQVWGGAASSNAKRSKPQQVLPVMLTKVPLVDERDGSNAVNTGASVSRMNQNSKYDVELRPVKILLERIDPSKLARRPRGNEKNEEFIGLDEADVVQLQQDQRSAASTSAGIRSILVTERTESPKGFQKKKVQFSQMTDVMFVTACYGASNKGTPDGMAVKSDCDLPNGNGAETRSAKRKGIARSYTTVEPQESAVEQIKKRKVPISDTPNVDPPQINQSAEISARLNADAKHSAPPTANTDMVQASTASSAVTAQISGQPELASPRIASKRSEDSLTLASLKEKSQLQSELVLESCEKTKKATVGNHTATEESAPIGPSADRDVRSVVCDNVNSSQTPEPSSPVPAACQNSPSPNGQTLELTPTIACQSVELSPCQGPSFPETVAPVPVPASTLLSAQDTTPVEAKTASTANTPTVFQIPLPTRVVHPKASPQAESQWQPANLSSSCHQDPVIVTESNDEGLKLEPDACSSAKLNNDGITCVETTTIASAFASTSSIFQPSSAQNITPKLMKSLKSSKGAKSAKDSTPPIATAVIARKIEVPFLDDLDEDALLADNSPPDPNVNSPAKAENRSFNGIYLSPEEERLENQLLNDMTEEDGFLDPGDKRGFTFPVLDP